MKQIILFTSILVLIFFGDIKAQTNIDASAKNWTSHNSEASFNDEIIYLKNGGKGSALLWANNTNFKNGIIELDIKGKDLRGKSFVGLAFHGLDNKNYDAVYFRPFNFNNPERKNHSIQYIDAPNNVWHVLRKKFPGKYENVVQPIPDPNDWFHVRIEINSPEVKVFVNDANEPTLVVEKISDRTKGKLGLWIDSEEGWFKNVKIIANNQ
ncbi:MAG: family 16 glycoside hydrolase [Bacteroidota bacterium]